MEQDRSNGSNQFARVIHPHLFAVYPVAFLLAQNVDEMPVSDSYRAFIAAAMYGVVVWGIVRIAVREPHRAGVIASLLIAATYLYADFSGANWQVAVVAAGIFVLVALIAVSSVEWARYTGYLNAVALTLLLISTIQIIPFAAARTDGESASSGLLRSAAPVPPDQPMEAADSPNIYYVILDGYGRHDMLERFYGYDNSEFIGFLREQGFHVADRARSNYARTALSVVSTLYAEHLIAYINDNELVGSRDVQRILELLSHSTAFRFLKSRGYRTYAYSSTNIEYPADELVVPQAPFSYFEREVAARTPFDPILDKVYQLNSYRIHYQVILDTIARMNAAVESPSPKFVLTHIVCPHPPLVFDREGNYRNEGKRDHRLTDGDAMVGEMMSAEDYRRLYADQIHWLNGEIKAFVRRVRNDDPNAIVVLQGDHGPGSMLHWDSLEKTNMLERFSILNAIYLPGAPEDILYPNVSNVNTFRIIFNCYFGTELPLLPDTSYFSEARLPLLLYEIQFPDSREEDTSAGNTVE